MSFYGVMWDGRFSQCHVELNRPSPLGAKESRINRGALCGALTLHPGGSNRMRQEWASVHPAHSLKPPTGQFMTPMHPAPGPDSDFDAG